jgi:hypothetical protein
LQIFPYSLGLRRSRRLEQRGCDFSAHASLFLFIVLATYSFADADLSSPPALPIDIIVQKLMAANAQRSQTLRGYRGKRIYHVQYQGLFGSHEAGIQVEAVYTAPDQKDFKVISQNGSSLLINRVLLKLLSSEQEAQKEQNRKQLEISPKNYDFALAGTEHTPAGDFYILSVSPRGRSKYLYRGKMWIDAKDFAVTRMDGEPASNPSLWVSHTQIAYRWGKIAGFWLPVHNESQTQVRMGGKAVLTIDYIDYQVTAANRGAPRSPGESPELPDPSTVSGDPH